MHTSKSEDDPIPLSEYVSGMKEGQKGIYYIAADSLAAAAASPFVEQLQRRGLEVQPALALGAVAASTGCPGCPHSTAAAMHLCINLMLCCLQCLRSAHRRAMLRCTSC